MRNPFATVNRRRRRFNQGSLAAMDAIDTTPSGGEVPPPAASVLEMLFFGVAAADDGMLMLDTMGEM